MTEGKCSRKKWAWKPVKAELITFLPKDPIGTIYCTLEASNFCTEELESAKATAWFIPEESSETYLKFKIRGQSKKELQIESFNSLKAFVSSTFTSADRAIICSKKSVTQTATIRCGSK